jgi:hypothetical protein
MPTSPSPKTLLRTGLFLVLAPVIMVAAFVVPSHEPKANDLPIAVAGPPAAARVLLRPLGDVHLIHASNAAAARHAVRDRSAYGAIVTGVHPSIDIASGQSFVAATVLKQAGLQARIPPTQIRDLAPLPSGDPRGTALNLTMLALLVGSIVVGTLLVALAPGLRRGRREGMLLSIAIGVGTGTVAVLKAVSALPGPFLAEMGLVAGVVLAVGLIASGLVRLRGPIGTNLAFLFFLVIANPASGLATAPDMLPTPWGQAGPLLPPGAAGQAIRGSAYFGGAADLGPILVLLAWMGLGVGLNLLAYRRTPAAGDPQPDGAPVRSDEDTTRRARRLVGRRRRGHGSGPGAERTLR